MKKRLGSVLCRCTIYIRQPGSLREAACSLLKICATSSSCPGFAIQVTASTTTLSSASILILGCSAQPIERLREVRNEHRLLAVRSGRDDANLRSGFLLHEFKIALGLLREPIVIVDTKRVRLPARQLRINRLDLLVA